MFHTRSSRHLFLVLYFKKKIQINSTRRGWAINKEGETKANFTIINRVGNEEKQLRRQRAPDCVVVSSPHCSTVGYELRPISAGWQGLAAVERGSCCCQGRGLALAYVTRTGLEPFEGATRLRTDDIERPCWLHNATTRLHSLSQG